jgi:hypothetical protein
MPDPNHAVQEERGEREHHERMEQLQMGDLNAETSIAMSKMPEPDPQETQVGERTAEGGDPDEPRMPRILESPYTQYRKL